MKKSISLFFLAALATLSAVAEKRPVDFVNTFIGTAATGHTYPGATTPFGLVQTSPVTGATGWQYCTQYVYDDEIIWGFTQTNLNGTGCTDLGDILMMPTSAARNKQTGVAPSENFRSRYRKPTQQATPGYYTVYLDEPQVKVELTATPHVALHRYTFDAPDSAAVLIDLQHGPTWTQQLYETHVKACELNYENDHTLSGHVHTSLWVEQDVYFVITFSKPFTRTQQLPARAETERGSRTLCFFDVKSGEAVEAKIALSSVSIEGAWKNMKAEQPDFDFEGVLTKAHEQWNTLLSRFEVEGTDEQKQNFYTSFYHTLIQPNNIADVDGTYCDCNGRVSKAEGGTFYSTFSCWDTYRAAHPFYTVAMPEIVDPLVRSLILQGEAQGHLPIWCLWGKENYCMIGNHSVSIVAEAYHKGFRGFDAERAWAAIKKTQTVSHKEKTDWETYMKYGYYPCDLIPSENVSSTLENVYDDYAAWDMARLMGKKDEQAYFARRKDFYKNLFDPSTHFMRPKNADGTWKTPFNPLDLAHAESTGGDYTEGNAWQYTWHVQHDVPGLIKLFGGEKQFCEKLDSFFTVQLNSTLSDVTGLIGQYAHGNEPSHHVAYLYTLAGKPERTQELVRQIFDTQYLPRPDGLCGNDDCGQMSAWYLLSAMGFYPVNPVSGQYVFGAPQLPRITLNLPDGKKFTVVAEGISKENLHVKAIYLNGKRMKGKYITHEQITRGGTLRFVMGK